MRNLLRPTLLMAEPEPDEALSSRKVVMESAKFNVISAYSGEEALALLDRFPNVDAVLIHSGLPDLDCDELAKKMKKNKPKTPVIFVREEEKDECSAAEINVSAGEPGEIVPVLRTLLGDPRQIPTERYDSLSS